MSVFDAIQNGVSSIQYSFHVVIKDERSHGVWHAALAVRSFLTQL